MPLPPQYQSRALPTPGRVVPKGDGIMASAIGSGLADAGAQLRGAAARREDADQRVAELDAAAARIEDRQQLTSKVASRAAAFEQMQTALANDILTLRETAGPDYEQKVADAVEKRSTDFMGTLDDPRLVDHFVAPMASVVGKTKLQEREWSIKQRSDMLGRDHDDFISEAANRLANARPTPEQLQGVIDQAGKTIDLYNIPANAKALLKEDARKRLTLGAAENLFRDDPKALLASVDAGDFATILDDKQLPVYRAKVEARIHSLESAQRAATSAKVSEWKEQVRVAIEDATDGVSTDPAAMLQMAEQARAIGEQALAQDADKAAALANINAKYVAASEPELRGAMRDIESRKDWQADRKLVQSHEQLGRLADKVAKRAKDDPVGLFISQGGGVGLPQFDLSDPAVMQRYFAVGEAASKRFGQPVKYIPDELAAPIRDQFKGSSAADKAVMVTNLTAYGRQRAGGLFRQIAPAEPKYATLLDLATMRDRGHGLNLAAEALNGWEQLAANPKLVDAQQAQQIQQRNAAPLAMLSGPARAGILETANGLYAARAVRAGAKSFDRTLYENALSDALGRAGDTGGIGEAPNGQKMVLPRGVTQGDVDVVLARADSAAIINSAYGGPDAPLWGDKQLTPAQMKRLTPVLVADDNGAAVYAFRSDTGFLQSQKHPGQNFLLDLRQLAKRSAR